LHILEKLPTIIVLLGPSAREISVLVRHTAACHMPGTSLSIYKYIVSNTL
jgi:hypothetical protein